MAERFSRVALDIYFKVWGRKFMRTATVRVGELYPDQTMEEAIDILKIVRNSIQNLISESHIRIMRSLIEITNVIGLKLLQRTLKMQSQLDDVRALRTPQTQGYFFGFLAPAADWLFKIKRQRSQNLTN